MPKTTRSKFNKRLDKSSTNSQKVIKTAKNNGSLKIYLLLLEEGKRYVGKSCCPNKRFRQHLDGKLKKGAMWTKKYKIISDKPIILCADAVDEDEDKFTEMQMRECGIANVRGGSYSSLKLKPSQLEHLNHKINSSADKCFECGKTGHFANACPSRKCFKCEKTGHYAKNCPNPGVSECNLCKKTGHVYTDCPNRNNKPSDLESVKKVVSSYKTRNKNEIKWIQRAISYLEFLEKNDIVPTRTTGRPAEENTLGEWFCRNKRKHSSATLKNDKIHEIFNQVIRLNDSY